MASSFFATFPTQFCYELPNRCCVESIEILELECGRVARLKLFMMTSYIFDKIVSCRILKKNLDLALLTGCLNTYKHFSVIAHEKASRIKISFFRMKHKQGRSLKT